MTPRPGKDKNEGRTMHRVLRNHSLTIVMFGLFAIFLIAQSLTGFRSYNHEQRQHEEATVSYVSYLQTGHFVEATFENWESEFLQMGVYVALTAFLIQRGSAESKKPDGDNPSDEDPRQDQGKADVPWPVRQGGIILVLYEYSLTIALMLLFVISFILHAMGGARAFSAQEIAHGGEAVSTLGFLRTSKFWFESFQNWQSEFLAVASLAVLSIYLRQKGSPQSKPVAAPQSQTGES
jgi:membrane protein implicated in regulation of membrane protease activity